MESKNLPLVADKQDSKFSAGLLWIIETLGSKKEHAYLSQSNIWIVLPRFVAGSELRWRRALFESFQNNSNERLPKARPTCGMTQHTNCGVKEKQTGIFWINSYPPVATLEYFRTLSGFSSCPHKILWSQKTKYLWSVIAILWSV
jgi:hypothetical protein